MDKILIAVDEVGWGCVAGPIVVCAAHVPGEHWDILRSWGFRDSKKVGNRLKVNPDRKRTEYSTGACEKLALRLEQEGKGLASWSLAQADPITIDLMTPADAKYKTFRTAIMLLIIKNNWRLDQVKVIVDGSHRLPNLPAEIEQEAIPKADDTVLPCSVASVLAKAVRDRQMVDLAALYPGFGFENHKGYPTQAHLEALLKLGPIKNLHRTHYLRSWLSKYYERTRDTKRKQFREPPPKWLVETGWLEKGYVGYAKPANRVQYP